MVHPEMFIFKYDKSECRENQQSYNFLYYFQLNKGEGPTVSFIPYSVCRNLEGIFKQSNKPAEQDY